MLSFYVYNKEQILLYLYFLLLLYILFLKYKFNIGFCTFATRFYLFIYLFD